MTTPFTRFGNKVVVAASIITLSVILGSWYQIAYGQEVDQTATVETSAPAQIQTPDLPISAVSTAVRAAARKNPSMTIRDAHLLTHDENVEVELGQIYDILRKIEQNTRK